MGILDRILSWATERQRALREPTPGPPETGQIAPAPAPAASDAEADAWSLATAHRLIDEGNAAEDAGDLDRALLAYRTASAHAPLLGRAHLNIGNVRMAAGDLAGALAGFDAALRVQPHYPGAHFNKGNAYRIAGHFELALESYDRGIEQDPGFVDAHIARAALLDDMGRLDASAAGYEQALSLAPDLPEVRADYAQVLARLCRFSDALVQCRSVLAIAPGLAKARALEAGLLKDTGRFDDAMAAFSRAVSEAPESAEILSSMLFTMNYRAPRPDPLLLEHARHYGDLVRRQARPWTDWSNEPDPERRLRIGFVSGDLRSHPVAYFLEGMLVALREAKPKSLDLIAYSTRPAADATTERLQPLFDAWHNISEMRDAAAGELIRQDRIDILIDLAGHTGGHRLPLFAWKPAPVQATWLGYFATTGLREIDYILVDEACVPPGEEHDFVETPWRLPTTRLCFTEPRERALVGGLPALGGAGVVFGCFNHLAKMGDNVVETWSRILHAVPGSRLLLKSPPLAEEAARATTLARFSRHGVDAARIMTEGLSTRLGYLEAYRGVDIGLDPFPYPGGTTSAESLWMGVPFVTMRGARLLGRQGSGMLRCVGLDDWIADTEEDYIRIAVQKASDLQSLARLRAGLRSRALASPLFDSRLFARHFTEAMQAMWRQWCRSRN